MRKLFFGALAALMLPLVSDAHAGTFCVKRGMFPEPNTWVRIGSCGKGGCKSLPRLALHPNGGYVCGVMQTDMSRRFSFPHGGKRIYGKKRGRTVYFN